MNTHLDHLRDLLSRRLADLPGTMGLVGRARTTMDELFAGRVPKLGDTVLCQTCDGTGVNGEYKDIALVRLELRGRRS